MTKFILKKHQIKYLYTASTVSLVVVIEGSKYAWCQIQYIASTNHLKGAFRTKYHYFWYSSGYHNFVLFHFDSYKYLNWRADLVVKYIKNYANSWYLHEILLMISGKLSQSDCHFALTHNVQLGKFIIFLDCGTA